MSKIVKDKPILKWVGGKTQILDKLFINFPKEINNYHELFIGGGSVLFKLLLEVKNNNIKINNNINAYDINEPLIFLYKNIKDIPNEFYQEIQKIIDDYNSIESLNGNRTPQNIDEAKTSKESYYYWIRKEYNNLSNTEKTTIIGSSYFLFLNKIGFRGLFRLNSKKEFNVPFGNYKNPEIINHEHLIYISELIKNVNFYCLDYKKSLELVEENDFVYLDPPYYPEKNNSFVSYTENGFDKNEHQIFFDSCKKLKNKNIKFVLSNSDVEIIRENFKDVIYNIVSISCKRSINSKNPESKTNEVIIKNYM